jgi:hypothetical protein
MIAKFSRKDFLEALFVDYYKEHRGFTLVKSFKRGDAKMSTRYFPNIDILAKEQYGEDRDVFFGVCPRERMKAEKEHIRYIVALWADLDIGRDGHEEKQRFFEGPREAAKAIRSFPRAPSIIVESGRGAHLYWLLRQVTEVTDPERVEAIIKKISHFLLCDTEAGLDAVLRLPETVNTKIPSAPMDCEVKFINNNFRYALEDFETLGQRIVPPQPSFSAAEARQGGSPGKPAAAKQAPSQPAFSPTEIQPPSLDDSLVLDETIIDELIDDISMTATEITDVAASSRLSSPVAPVHQAPTSSGLVSTVSSVVTPGRSVSAPAAPTTGVLERLLSSGTEVEIALMASEQTIKGILNWSENGLIGVEVGDHIYTIPLSSISFIKSRVG